MKVKELIELLDGANPEYEVELDLPNMTIADSYVADYASKKIYLETFQLRGEKDLIDLDEIANRR